MVELAPNPFQEDGFGIPSHYMILYIYIYIHIYSILYSIDVYSTIIYGAMVGNGTQSLSRSWI